MRVVLGQFGAPTAVLNASLYGVADGFRDQNVELYGAVGGAFGLLQSQFAPFTEDLESLSWLKSTPGAALRAGRHADFSSVVDQAVENLRRFGADGLVVMGGNGTMGLGHSIHEAAKTKGYSLQVVGVPKTIDNDILGIDHAPGFPSAANFVIKAVRDLTLDLEAMVGFEQVRVVEVMGRKAGWLAAAAVLAPVPKDKAPIVLLPERPLQWQRVLTEIKQRVNEVGSALVVVSEGVRDESGQLVTQAGEMREKSSYSMLGGIGGQIATSLRNDLGYGVRYENLGLLQRCWAESAVPTDIENALRLGREGARVMLKGASGIMVGLAPGGSSNGLIELALQQVAAGERTMNELELKLDDALKNWLKSLVHYADIRPHPRLIQTNSEGRVRV